MTTHTNILGISYYSRTVDGARQYSFSPQFDSCWTHEQEMEINAKTIRPQIINTLTLLIRELPDAEDCHRAGDDDQSMQVTIGADDRLSQWVWHTGGNSFWGDAYLYPIWAVATLSPDSVPTDIADDIINQLLEAAQ